MSLKKYIAGGLVKSKYTWQERFWMGWPFKSWLGTVNFLFFQWFFCRLTKCITITQDYKTNHAVVSYYIQWGVVPLTGWWTPYVWIRLEIMEEWAFHVLRGGWRK